MDVKTPNIDIENLVKEGIYLGKQHENDGIQYSVNCRSTITDIEIIKQLKNQINTKPNKWRAKYFVSDNLLKNKIYPRYSKRNSNCNYFWKEFKDNNIQHYISISKPENEFYGHLQNQNDLIVVQVQVLEYEFKEDSEFKPFKYRWYDFLDGSFHDALIYSKHTKNQLEVSKNINEIRNLKKKYYQLCPTRSPIVEWIFRRGSKKEDFQIPTYPTALMDLLDFQKEYEKFEQYLNKKPEKNEEIEKWIQIATELSEQIDYEQLEKDGVDL